MADPILPTSDVEVPAFSLPTGTEHFPANASALQTAVNNAALNDIIWLEAGTDYDFGSSPLTLDNKTSGSGWIYIISDAYLSLPAEGWRVAPSDASNMARLSSNALSQFVENENSAHHYRFVGIHIEANTNQAVGRLVQIQRTSGSGTANQPHHILFDRCYIHGQDGTGQNTRGVRLAGMHLGVISSYVDNFKNSSQDAQAIWISEGTGPFLIRNCYLEGGAENVMTGGWSIPDPEMVPLDITIEYCFFEKRDSFHTGPNVFCKNIFESKSGHRILIQYCAFHHCWPEEQDGAWLNITSNADSNGMSHCQTTDLTIRYNLAWNVAVGIGTNGLGDFDEDPVTDVLYEHNVCIVGAEALGNRNCIDCLGNDGSPFNQQFRHNTILLTGATGATMFVQHPTAAPTLIMQDNIFSRGSRGVTDSPGGGNEGTTTLNSEHTTYTFTNNAIIGASSGNYPANNFFPANIAACNFTNYQADGSGDYSIASGALKNAASDGTDVGADWNAFKDQIAAAISGDLFEGGEGGGGSIFIAAWARASNPGAMVLS
jgi:hypothetical protein